jgi:hypothetical protein
MVWNSINLNNPSCFFFSYRHPNFSIPFFNSFLSPAHSTCINRKRENLNHIPNWPTKRKLREEKLNLSQYPVWKPRMVRMLKQILGCKPRKLFQFDLVFCSLHALPWLLRLQWSLVCGPLKSVAQPCQQRGWTGRPITAWSGKPNARLINWPDRARPSLDLSSFDLCGPTPMDLA